MSRGPQRRGAQWSCISCIGLRPALSIPFAIHDCVNIGLISLLLAFPQYSCSYIMINAKLEFLWGIEVASHREGSTHISFAVNKISPIASDNFGPAGGIFDQWNQIKLISWHGIASFTCDKTPPYFQWRKDWKKFWSFCGITIKPLWYHQRRAEPDAYQYISSCRYRVWNQGDNCR